MPGSPARRVAAHVEVRNIRRHQAARSSADSLEAGTGPGLMR
jgi:hypothetical protein